jgi:ABC-type antimicrobial peptide transport system permease subunit
MEQVFADPYVDIVIFVLLCVGLIALVLGISTLRSIGAMTYREASRIARRGFINSLPIIAIGIISNSVILGVSYPWEAARGATLGTKFLLGWGAMNCFFLLCGGVMLLSAIVARRRLRALDMRIDDER